MNEAQPTTELLKKLGLPPQTIEPKLLQQALTHKSVMANRQTTHTNHNERLEYLGDAFLKSSISEWLFKHMPDFSEGHMSQIRSYVVSDAALSKAAQRIELAKFIHVGESEKSAQPEIRESILANVFESLCGAIFLSSDFRTTAQIILKLLAPELKMAVQGQADEVLNYKALLQEYAQGKYKILPDYQLTSSDGPDHNRIFHIQVYLNQELLGQGTGRSKKKAEQEAAREVLLRMNLLDQEPRSLSPSAKRFFASQHAEPLTQTKKLQIAPSVLSADFSNLGLAIKQIESGGASWVHLDIMDGHFVPNITFGPDVVKSLRKLSSGIFDAHLMISEPEKYIEAFASAGCNRITVHYETCPHLDRVISQIHEAGMLPGVSLNPATPVSVLEDILHKLHLILIMSVNPGFGGQKFIPQALKKVQQISKQRAALNLEDQILIQIDGGINDQTLDQAVASGAEIMVMGSAIFNQPDPTQSIQYYQQRLLELEAQL